MNKYTITFLTTIITLTSFNVFAKLGDGKDGYWNYEIKIHTKTATTTLPKKPKPPAPLPSNKVLMKLHPDQIQVLVERWRKHAIYTLEPKDVSEALRIQDIARRKASGYAAVVGMVNQTNPNLSLIDEVPTTNAGMQAQFNSRQNKMNEYLLRATKNYGLLYFSSATCEYCKVQDRILQQLLNVFRFDLKVVNTPKKPLLASKFNIKQTPSIIIVNRRTKKHLPISFGMLSLPALKENIYRAVRLIQKEITPTQFFTNERDIGTGLDPANKQ